MIAHFCARVSQIVAASGTHQSDVRQIQAPSNLSHIEEHFMVHQAGLTSKDSQRLRRRCQGQEARHKVDSISNESVKIANLTSNPGRACITHPDCCRSIGHERT
ncbi:uncharacterized protein MELLADRAFT_105806 [Melampsora larici-populina 98AG31]|uniref:Uncharacterized protein n=1 Tax=Melampsora larici-populina (strain 98AG31 / pathotype 3-4-7) TaxID=747676 RepID=F4RJE4_MELLP|nr:uncharacterized protein MELLADRAFT_105806 [Melampsora larici-populina 98AG31]EGG07299.1 hypothetical protein MELLADRAFT_105806 [Melampsora larici-populina 98AG31]